MTSNRQNETLLNTKFHRPRLTSDLVLRSRLQTVLGDGLDRPMILVTASAGFGKSTLVSAWLESCNLPKAWISLDEADNDFGLFLAYFLGAMRTIFPDSLAKTETFPTGVSLPIVSVIATSLINELDELGRDFILVLDDYHFIREQSVHELLGILLQHPPQGMHLVIVSRLDPPLPLGLLRSHNKVVEIRGQDLRFTKDEIALFVERTIGTPLTANALSVLAEKTEGWAAGLRLAMLAFRQSVMVDIRITGLEAENRYIFDYLMHEVLSRVPPAMHNFLLKSSILDRMCASLCQEVIGTDDPECRPQEYLAWLEEANMFTIALDSRGEWYRYHHLFQQLLQDQLVQQISADEISALQVRASCWYYRRGLLEEALQHALAGHDTSEAVRYVAEHRHALMDVERWQLYERCLRMFPDDTVAEHPDLLLMAAWIAQLRQHDSPHSLVLVDQAESLLAEIADQPERAVLLRGEIDTLRAVVACESATDPEAVIALARRALATTPRAWYYVRSVAWIYLAAAYQMTGRLDLAFAALTEGQPEDVAANNAVRARVVGSSGFIQWMAGDLPAIEQGAAYLLTVGETHQRRESLAWAHYLLGIVAYHRNDLATAEAHIRAIEGLRYVARPLSYVHCAFMQVLICQARGQSDVARHKIELIFEFLRETRNEGLVPLAQAYQAELAVMQGNLGVARHWAKTIAPYLPLTLMAYFYAPQLTLPKFLLAQNTPASLEQAAAVLSELHNFVTARHNTRFTIEVLALQALLQDAQGDERAALALLQQAISLAEPGGFIRLFVDLGPGLARLLVRLQQTVVASDYVGQILQAFGEPTPVPSSAKATGSSAYRIELVEPLTEREGEVLTLLAQRMTNKEIAQALHISPLTVKRHLTTIYGKLQANGRREAVAKAISLGLIRGISRL